MTAAPPRRLEHAIDLVRELVLRDVRLRYRRSALGLLWSQIGPLATLLVLNFLFTRVVPLGIENYATFTFIGLLAWYWFQGSLQAATGSVPANADLVRQPAFPVVLLPVATVLSHLVHFLLGLPLLFIAIAVTSGIHVTASALPAIIAVEAIVLLGPAYVLAALNARFRDVGHVVGLVLRLMFFATPIFYNATRLTDSRFELFYRWNPLARLISAYRDALLLGRWPDVRTIVILVVAGTAGTLLGSRVYVHAASRFAEEA